MGKNNLYFFRSRATTIGNAHQFIELELPCIKIGDGIHDASNTNAVDVGISVENSVAIAKDAADFVTLDRNSSVLIEIQEGRKTFSNTLKYIYIRRGSSSGNMCSVAMASIILHLSNN